MGGVCCDCSKAPWCCWLRAAVISHGVSMAGRGGACVVLAVSGSATPSTTSIKGESQAVQSAVAVFQSGSSSKEN